MRGSGLIPVALCLAVVGLPARADEAQEPRAVIQKAIEASGGEAKLEKNKAIRMKSKGTVHVQGMTIDFSGEFLRQLPKQSKATLEAEAGGMKLDIVMVVNGDKGWRQIQGMTTEIDKDEMERQQQALYGEWIGRLVPLLKDRGFTLSPLGEIKIDGKDAVGVKVAHKGHGDVEMFFDKKTGLLLKQQQRVKDETGKEVTQESFYRHYKDFDGFKRPEEVVIKRDGQDFLDMKISEYKLMEKVDDSEFAMP